MDDRVFFKMPFRPCPSGCGRFLSAVDWHDRCLQCLGFQHAEDAFVDDSCICCGRMSMISLRSRLSFMKGLAPSAATRADLSGSSRGSPADALGDLRVTVRASPRARPHGPLTPHAANIPSGSRVISLVCPMGRPAFHLTLAGASSLSQESGAPRVPARPQVVQEVDEAALTQATRRCWNLLFLRRRREQRRSFPWWRAGRRIFRFCSAAGPRASGRYPLSQESVISFSSGFSGPWDDSVRRPASSLSPTTHFASSQESTVRGRHSSPRTSGQSRLGPREFGEDASERTAFCTIHPYSLSLHHHRYVDCAVGAACTASGGVAHAAQPVSLAHAHNSTRLRDSVRHATSQVQRRSRDVGGSPERPCLARGDCCPPGKGRNLAGPSSREEAGVLQPLLHRTQETWWPSTNPGSPSFEPGFIQAPVQDADAQAHYQMHLAPGLVCSDRPEGCLLSCFDPSVTQTVLAFLRLKVGHGSTGSSPSDSPCLPVCSRRP